MSIDAPMAAQLPAPDGFSGYTITGNDNTAAAVFTMIFGEGSRVDIPLPTREHVTAARKKLEELESSIIEAGEALGDLDL